MARSIGCSHVTVSKIFSSPRTPAWDTLALIIDLLDGDTDHFKRLWYEATGGEAMESSVGRADEISARENGIQSEVGDSPRPATLTPAPWPDLQSELQISPEGATLSLIKESISNIYAQSTTDNPVEKLPAVLDDTEDLIVGCCRKVLLASLGNQVSPQRPHLLKQVVCTDSGIFTIRIGADLQSDRTLHLVLQPVQAAEAAREESHFKATINVAESIGRYNTIEISTPGCLGIDFFEAVRKHIADIFSAGYSWLGEFTRRAFGSLVTPFGREALHLFRHQLLTHGRENVAEQVWMTMAGRRGVSHVVDDDVVGRTLQSANAIDHLQWSPAAVGLAFLADFVPFRKSFAQQALAERRAIDVDLARAPYRDVRRDFLVGQSLLYQDRMRVVPLARNSEISLLAVYPGHHEAEIRDALHFANAALTEYISSTRTPN